MKFLLFFSCYIISILYCTADLSANVKDSIRLSPKEMLEDVEYHYLRLTECHPKFDQYYSRRAIDSTYNVLKEECAQDSMSLYKFQYLVAQLNHLMDGHSLTSHFFFEIDNKIKNRFPFIEKKSKVVYYNDEVLSAVNGIDIQLIIEEVDKFIPWEYSDYRKNIYRNLFLSPVLDFKFGIRAPYYCTLINKVTHKDRTIPIVETDKEWLPKIQIRTGFSKRLHSKPVNSIYFEADSIATLYYNSSAISSSEDILKFDSYFTCFFDSLKIRNIKNIFIDISQNGGGSDGVNELIYKHLKTNYKVHKYINTTTRYGKEVIEGKSSKDILIEPLKNEILTSEYNLTLDDNPSGYGGKVYVIMSENTYSAASDFCQIMKSSQLATLVGKAAGQRFPYSGNIVFDQLPNSGIHFFYAIFFSDKEDYKQTMDKDGFIQPDIVYPLDHILNLEDYKNIIQIDKQRNKH